MIMTISNNNAMVDIIDKVSRLRTPFISYFLHFTR